MKRILKISVISGVITSLLLIGLFGYKRFYLDKHKLSFNKWHSEKKYEPSQTPASPVIHTFEHISPVLHIDTIYRSMQGPLQVEYVKLNSEERSIFSKLFDKPTIYWLVGYSAEVIDESGKKISDDFLCHNNLDIYDKNTLPWKMNTLGVFSRMFTLTAGQTSVILPEGYGIPVLSFTDLVVSSQALNHNYPDTTISVRHRVKIKYIKDSELTTPMKPLFQQAVFVTKKLSGPEGLYNEVPVKFQPTSPIQAPGSKHGQDSAVCCTGRNFDETFNPYQDTYGRHFTGHWSFAPGKETLHSPATRMLALPYDTKLHFIGMHAHPFCASIELYDKTDNKTIFKGNNKNLTDRIGLEYLDQFESKEGLILFTNHQYELISEYDNTTNDYHTAMATMFLYLEEK